jgi:hypothetical protein
MRRAVSGPRVLSIGLLLCLCCAQVRAVETVVLEQPRAFGYVLGDTLVQRVLLQVSSRSFAPISRRRQNARDCGSTAVRHGWSDPAMGGSGW